MDSARERFFDSWPTRAIATAHWQSFDENARVAAASGQQNARGSWWMLALMVEGLVMLGERAQAGRALSAGS